MVDNWTHIIPSTANATRINRRNHPIKPASRERTRCRRKCFLQNAQAPALQFALADRPGFFPSQPTSRVASGPVNSILQAVQRADNGLEGSKKKPPKQVARGALRDRNQTVRVSDRRKAEGGDRVPGLMILIFRFSPHNAGGNVAETRRSRQRFSTDPPAVRAAVSRAD